jgi:hypothetical protein
MALLVVLAVSIGAGYSVVSVLDQAFLIHPGTRQVLVRDLSKQVDLPQTVNGFTMTVKRVYADANQIVIGYNVTGPDDRTFLGFSFPVGTTGPLLTDEQGHQFKPMLGVGAGMEGAIGGYVLTYDGESISRDTKELNLRLEVPALLAIEEVSISGRPIADKVECSDDYENICFVTVNGPLIYNFTVPVAGGRIADLHQTIEAEGVAVTLERVVVAPSGTRVYLSGIGPNARVELSIDGSKYELYSPRSAAPGAIESQWEYLSDSLLDKEGEWTLIIQPERQAAEPSQPTVGKGPLIFIFAVP